jgi:hypothetical protein
MVRCVAGCTLGACPRPLGDLLFRCTRLVPLPRVAVASPGCPRCVRALAIARALPSSPTGCLIVSARAIAFVPRLSSAPARPVGAGGRTRDLAVTTPGDRCRAPDRVSRRFCSAAGDTLGTTTALPGRQLPGDRAAGMERDRPGRCFRGASDR